MRHAGVRCARRQCGPCRRCWASSSGERVRPFSAAATKRASRSGSLRVVPAAAGRKCLLAHALRPCMLCRGGRPAARPLRPASLNCSANIAALGRRVDCKRKPNPSAAILVLAVQNEPPCASTGDKAANQWRHVLTAGLGQEGPKNSRPIPQPSPAALVSSSAPGHPVFLVPSHTDDELLQLHPATAPLTAPRLLPPVRSLQPV